MVKRACPGLAHAVVSQREVVVRGPFGEGAERAGDMLPGGLFWRWRDVEGVPAAGLALRTQSPHGRVHDHLAQRRPRRLLAAGELLVEGAADDAGISLLGVTDNAGLVDFVAAEAKIRSRDFNVGVSNVELPSATMPGDLATLLRRVVLVRKAALGQGLNGERVGLGAVGGGDQLIVRILGLRQPGRALGGVLGEGGKIARFEQFPRTPRAGKRGGGVVDDPRDAVIGIGDDRGNAHASPAGSVVRRKLCAPA